MSDDPEERLRNLRDAIEDVIEILEGVKERARGFVAKQIEAEKASAEAQSKLDYLKTQLANQANELATAEGRLAALRSGHDQLYLSRTDRINRTCACYIRHPPSSKKFVLFRKRGLPSVSASELR